MIKIGDVIKTTPMWCSCGKCYCCTNGKFIVTSIGHSTMHNDDLIQCSSVDEIPRSFWASELDFYFELI